MQIRLLLVLCLTLFVLTPSAAAQTSPCAKGQESGLPQRLYYLTSNLQTKGTAIENWKFQIAQASQDAAVR